MSLIIPLWIYSNTSYACFERAFRELCMGRAHEKTCGNSYNSGLFERSFLTASCYIEEINLCNPNLGQDMCIYKHNWISFISSPGYQVTVKLVQNVLPPLTETIINAREPAFLYSGKANTDLICQASCIALKTNSLKG